MLAVVVSRSEKRSVQFDRTAVFPEISRTCIRCADPVLVAVIACVEEIQFIGDRYRRSGVCSLVVKITVRLQSDACILPDDQVLRRYMVPVLETMHRAPWTPLIEKMPKPVVLYKAVRIARQSRYRLDVICLPVYRCGVSVVQLTDVFRAFQNTITLLQCPFSHVCLLILISCQRSAFI